MGRVPGRDHGRIQLTFIDGFKPISMKVSKCRTTVTLCERNVNKADVTERYSLVKGSASCCLRAK